MDRKVVRSANVNIWPILLICVMFGVITPPFVQSCWRWEEVRLWAKPHHDLCPFYPRNRHWRKLVTRQRGTWRNNRFNNRDGSVYALRIWLLPQEIRRSIETDSAIFPFAELKLTICIQQDVHISLCNWKEKKSIFNCTDAITLLTAFYLLHIQLLGRFVDNLSANTKWLWGHFIHIIRPTNLIPCLQVYYHVTCNFTYYLFQDKIAPKRLMLFASKRGPFQPLVFLIR